MLADCRPGWRSWLPADVFDFCCVLTLVLLLTVVPKVWYVVVLIRALAIAGLAVPQLRKLPELWIAITGLLGSAVFLNWYWVDNHLYLECYWCLAICLGTMLPESERERALGTNSRNLLVLSMGCAVAWKALSPDYLSGEFFEYRLLTDERFELLAVCLSDLDAQTLIGNRELLLQIESATNAEAIVLRGTASVRHLSLLLTWWTIGIELMIAVLYALPRWRGVDVAREAVLICFLCTTYFAAPVIGFGWLLCVFGFAYCRSPARRHLFFLTFLVIQVFAMPLGDVARNSGFLD